MKSDGSLSSSGTKAENQALGFVSQPDLTHVALLHPGMDVSQLLPSESRFGKKPLHDNAGVTSLYFLAGAGLIKIGISNNLTSRLRGIRNSSPVPLTLLATMPATKHLEMRLHGKFRHLRKHGEWFEDEGSIRQTIAYFVRDRGAQWVEGAP